MRNDVFRIRGGFAGRGRADLRAAVAGNRAFFSKKYLDFFFFKHFIFQKNFVLPIGKSGLSD